MGLEYWTSARKVYTRDNICTALTANTDASHNELKRESGLCS